MNDRILLLTKDALCRDYLPVYGNGDWRGKTPNMDELAEKGTIFTSYYTAAPSTVMAFRSMMTGRFAHETPYADYSPAETPEAPDGFLAMAREQGYSCHIIWDVKWNTMVLKYGNCYGKDTIIHSLDGLRQSVGCHYKHERPLVPDPQISEQTIDRLMREVGRICVENDKVMLWIHLPHVIHGRTGYGGDIDLFDETIGQLRRYFEDDSIYISSDHGNMNGLKGKYCYGFDVYEPAIRIPLIAPRINDLRVCDWNVSNVDIKEIIFGNRIPKRAVIYSDTAYYAQPHRKTAVIKGDIKYIYNKPDRSEELYDLARDGTESRNLISDTHDDTDRHLKTITREVYFTPLWDDLPAIRTDMRKVFAAIRKNASPLVEAKERLLYYGKKYYVAIKTKLHGDAAARYRNG